MTVSKKTTGALLIIAILMKRKREKCRKKRLWARDWILRRESDDVTRKLIQEMRTEDPSGFKAMFRMTPEQFDTLLERVRPIITKKNTNMRRAIPCETRLMITLKYLSTGDSYRSLMHFFRVPHNTISGIVSLTCEAIFASLNAEHLKVIH